MCAVFTHISRSRRGHPTPAPFLRPPVPPASRRHRVARPGLPACLFWGSDRNCAVELPALAPVHGGSGLKIEPKGMGNMGGWVRSGQPTGLLTTPPRNFHHAQVRTHHTRHSIACEGNVTAGMGFMGELGCRLGAALAKQGGGVVHFLFWSLACGVSHLAAPPPKWRRWRP